MAILRLNAMAARTRRSTGMASRAGTRPQADALQRSPRLTAGSWPLALSKRGGYRAIRPSSACSACPGGRRECHGRRRGRRELGVSGRSTRGSKHGGDSWNSARRPRWAAASRSARSPEVVCKTLRLTLFPAVDARHDLTTHRIVATNANGITTTATKRSSTRWCARLHLLRRWRADHPQPGLPFQRQARAVAVQLDGRIVAAGFPPTTKRS